MQTANELGVDVLEVLENVYHLEGNVRGSEFDLVCEFHADTNPSCGVSLDTGYFFCFACHAKGDLVKLGMKVLGKPKEEVLKFIKAGFNPAGRAQRQVKALRQTTAERAVVDPRNLHKTERYLDGPFSYLRQRGFERGTIRYWKLRYVQEQEIVKSPKNFTIQHSIAIPMMCKGELQGWIYRKTEQASWQPKYLYTPHVDLNNFWFGIDEAQDKEVVIVEGSFDVLWLWQAGIPAIGILGSHTPQEKALQLTRFKKITIMTDWDVAGRLAARKLAELTHRNVPTMMARYPRSVVVRAKKKVDPQDLTPAILRKMVSRAIPYVSWKINHYQTEE